jgi:2-polyprenyl-3-methyl-5-hydroxy-6-metoxy-1,4-benzoquinol methylase
LVCQTFHPTQEELRVKDDAKDFYGREYWFSHQTEDYHHPDIFQRARWDLPERSLFWLKTLFKYKVPPGKALELGSAHGGFVAMMQWVGFEAIGLELSPWVVNFAETTFNVSMVCGPIEDQQFAPNTFDIIALMDVIEHLPDPLGTIQKCIDVLKPDGILLIQTPCYRNNKTYSELVETGDRFLIQFKETEHLYLFTENSARLLFERLGFPCISFEPAIFEYDMFFAVCRTPLRVNTEKEIVEALSNSPSGRLMLAMLDLDFAKNEVVNKWQEAEADRAARLEIIHQLQSQLKVSEADRAARLEVIHQLQAQLEVSEADRAARLEVIHQLQAQLEASEADRAARLKVIERQGAEIGQLHHRLYQIQTQLPVKVLQKFKLVHFNTAPRLTEEAEPGPQPNPNNKRVTLTHKTIDLQSESSEDKKIAYAFENYLATIENFNRSRPDMVPVGEYNHQMIDILNQLRPLKDKHLLDIGASPHGYALEWALHRSVASYTGIGLGIGETVEVNHKDSFGQLRYMNAEDLSFESETFDLIISLSTFEHFFNGSKVLQEMHRVLRRKGSVLINFQPVWTSSYGHHLHHVPSVAKIIPPWAHLLWNKETMRQVYNDKWPAEAQMSLEEAIEWIYQSDEINRIDVATIRNLFYASDFEIEWMTPLFDDESGDKRIIANYLAQALPYSAEDLMTLGYSVLLNK